jgi:hypothetical protein
MLVATDAQDPAITGRPTWGGNARAHGCPALIASDPSGAQI